MDPALHEDEQRNRGECRGHHRQPRGNRSWKSCGEITNRDNVGADGPRGRASDQDRLAQLLSGECMMRLNEILMNQRQLTHAGERSANRLEQQQVDGDRAHSAASTFGADPPMIAPRIADSSRMRTGVTPATIIAPATIATIDARTSAGLFM